MNRKHTDWLEARLLKLSKWSNSRTPYKSIAFQNALIQYCNNVRRKGLSSVLVDNSGVNLLS